jgi:hypothetical protein
VIPLPVFTQPSHWSGFDFETVARRFAPNGLRVKKKIKIDSALKP